MPASDVVVIGCRLPNGIKLRHPKNAKLEVELNGQNKDPAFRRAPFIVLTADSFGTTEVDKKFWDEWLAANKNFPPLKNSGIFVAKDVKEAESMALDLVKEKTGLEQMPQNAPGVKPVDDKQPSES